MATPGSKEFLALPIEQRRKQYEHATQSVKAEGGDASSVPSEAYFTPAEVAYLQAAANANMAPWMEEVKKKFPSQAAYLNNPEIASILKQAIDGKWPPAVLQSNLEASQWWISHSPQQRQWHHLNATDPAAALQSVQAQYSEIMAQAQSLGLNLDAGKLMTLSVQSLAMGWTEQQLREQMVDMSGGDITHGSMGATRSSLQGIANDYLLPVSDNSLDKWTRRIASGTTTAEVFKDQMSRTAISRYQDPGIQTALERGMTIREFADPYVQMAAQTLGVNPNDVDLLETKWNSALDHVDEKTGDRRAMSMSEWEQRIKLNPVYGYDSSKNGIQEASQLVGQLREQFGFS